MGVTAMPFRPIVLTRPIRVDRVVTVHYFEHSSSYYFEGERHDFWELLYVDRGEVDVLTESAVRRLGAGRSCSTAPASSTPCGPRGHRPPTWWW